MVNRLRRGVVRVVREVLRELEEKKKWKIEHFFCK